MSHVARIEIEVNDLEALSEAAELLGGRLVQGQKTYRWFGLHVGDYPLPDGVAESDLGKCDHAISFPGANYEIGVLGKGRGYTLIWDFYVSGGLLSVVGNNAVKLRNAYAERKVLREARKSRKRARVERLEDRTRITITV